MGLQHFSRSHHYKYVHRNHHQGAVLIELIITLPVLLMMIWLFIYIGVMYNARSSLISAMENSLRVALPRSNLSLSMDNEETLYSGLDSLCSSLDSGYLDALKPILFANVKAQDGFDEYNRNSSHWIGWYTSGDGGQFCEQPLHNIYAIIFTQLTMQSAVGSSIKFPCDPRSTDNNAGAGCLRCIPLNPCSLDRSNVENSCDQDTIFHRVAIECEFRPASIFVTPFDALSALVTGTMSNSLHVITHQALFETPVDINWNQ